MEDNRDMPLDGADLTKPGFVEKRMRLYNEHVKRLAEEAWEGCHGCDNVDKYFWISGFIAGYNRKTSENE
jgi:hypothetical protein